MLALLDPATGAVVAPPTLLLRPCIALDRMFTAAPSEENGYDVSADGARILARCDSLDAIPSALTVVVNWQSRLR